MLIALKSAHKAHSMSYDHSMRYTIVKIYSMGSPNGGRPTHIMYFHDVWPGGKEWNPRLWLKVLLVLPWLNLQKGDKCTFKYSQYNVVQVFDCSSNVHCRGVPVLCCGAHPGCEKE